MGLFPEVGLVLTLSLSSWCCVPGGRGVCGLSTAPPNAESSVRRVLEDPMSASGLGGAAWGGAEFLLRGEREACSVRLFL